METIFLEALRGFVCALIEPSPEAWEDFVVGLEWREFQKNEKLLSLERPERTLYFVCEGIARHYFFDNQQQEITTWFNEAGSLATDYAAFTTDAPSFFEIKAITTVRAWAISPAKLQALYDRYPCWERFGRLLNQFYLIQLIERNASMFVKTARQRYEELFERSPHLFNLVPLKHLASYLNIALETLSRIRAEK